VSPGSPGDLGAYIHIPFCRSRCDYCAFATWTDRDDLQGRYLDALRIEIERTGLTPITTAFVGGGTPSQVDPHHLGTVLDSLPLAPGAEVTIECNPDDVTLALLTEYRRHGVTRVSLGVQSMVPRVLDSLGRRHDPENVRRAVDAVRVAGFSTFNLDLIYGAAGETLDDWRRTLDAVVALDPPHVSAYGLTVEPGTPLAAEPDRYPDDDLQADEYLVTDDILGRAGLVSYEISNWAKPGHECRHNLLTWAMGEYVGFGCAAHSHRGGRRWWNVWSIDRYLARIADGRPAEAGGEALSEGDRQVEALQVALRTRAGVPAGSIDLAGVPSGLARVDGDRVRLTARGRLVANDLALRLSAD
jgi:putative oxygen-independent coproporphyrinogen III oxidase